MISWVPDPIKPWCPSVVQFLRENYPRIGRNACAEALGISRAVIRSRAHRMGLKRDADCASVLAAIEKRRVTATGRKRPAQSAALKRVIAENPWLYPQMWQPKPLPPKKVYPKAPVPTAEELERRRIASADRMRKRHAERGHPMKGRTHSEKSRKQMSVTRLLNPPSEEHMARRILKAAQTRARNGTRIVQRPNASWKAAWREVGGQRVFFRSAWEANYARYLEFLKKHGRVLSWEHEPETFWFDGIRRGAMSYLPDFRICRPGGAVEYHEVKGWMDDRSRTKIARMAKYHPTVKLVVVDAKAYRGIARSVGSIIPGWERGAK